jgi:hypothetical protein
MPTMHLSIKLFSVVVSVIAPVLQADAQYTGMTLELGGIPYYVPPDSVSQLDIGSDVLEFAKYNALQFIPFSIVPVNETNSLASTFDSWKVRDDVWTESFLTGA